MALLREPHCGVCWDRSHAWGLCRKHYDEFRQRVVQDVVMNDEATAG